MRKKIGVIARGLTKGGVGRLLKNILREFDKRKEFDFYLIYNQKDFFKKESYKNITKIFIPVKNKLKFDYIDSYKKIKELNLDYTIYPKNVIPINHFKLNCKKINIINDLGYFEKSINAYPFLDTLFMKVFIKISCKKSDKILAISKSTKDDIIKRFHINKNKIKIINAGIENLFKKTEDKKSLKKTLKNLKIKKPFLFYSGEITPRKNIWRVLKSFNSIKNNIPHNLYITGGKIKNSKDILKYINTNLKNRVKILGFISEKDLVNMYNLADLYLYPSLYEGFGLPILEAQSCGCPVLTSNATSCPEVAGDGALIVNPYSEKEISKGILKILNNKNYKNIIIINGLKNIKRYGCKKTTNKILEEIKWKN